LVTDRTITVADLAGEDYFFNTPRFSRGNLLRLVSGGNTEFVRVLDTSGQDTLKVDRGVNGTTAVEHPLNTPIGVWYPEEAMIRAVSRWVAYLVASFGRFDQITVDGLGGATKFPTDIPDEVKAIFREYSVETKLKAPRAV
jgi:hypothetical protein